MTVCIPTRKKCVVDLASFVPLETSVSTIETYNAIDVSKAMCIRNHVCLVNLAPSFLIQTSQLFDQYILKQVNAQPSIVTSTLRTLH